MGWTHYRAKVASLSRDRKPDDPELIAARRDLAVARVEARVAQAVADAPPLPEDVQRRLVELIRSAPAALGRAA